MQDAAAKAVSDLASQPFCNGRILSGVVLLAGQPNKIPHLLSRALANWTVTDLNANAVIWRESSDSSFITLQCSANCTVSVWVS